jgi:hypothetical protein
MLRDIKAAQKQTVLGVFWILISPLVSVAAMTVVFSKMLNVPSDGFPYPIFLFAGTFLWGQFSHAFGGTLGCVLANSNFIQKVYFPRLLMPLSASTSGFVNICIVFPTILIVMVFLGFPPKWTVVFCPLLIVAALATGMGIGLWAGALERHLSRCGPDRNLCADDRVLRHAGDLSRDGDLRAISLDHGPQPHGRLHRSLSSVPVRRPVRPVVADFRHSFYRPSPGRRCVLLHPPGRPLCGRDLSREQGVGSRKVRESKRGTVQEPTTDVRLREASLKQVKGPSTLLPVCSDVPKIGAWHDE